MASSRPITSSSAARHQRRPRQARRDGRPAGAGRGLGYRDVRTLLNSGNVVFTDPRGDAAKAAARIEKGIATKLGVTSRVVVLTAAEVAAALAANPLAAVATNPSRLFVAVLADPTDRRLDPLLAGTGNPKCLALGPRVAYIWCPEGMMDSPLAAAVAKALGDGVTTRNWATMGKLGNCRGIAALQGP